MIDSLICKALRGALVLPDGIDVGGWGERMAFHGVEALVYSQLAENKWPATALETLKAEALRHAMWEMQHQGMLNRALASLNRKGVSPIVIKGTAMAYALYADPALRSRSDTDLLAPPGSRRETNDALLSLGFTCDASDVEFASYQSSYCIEVQGTPHTFDVHWKINNSEVLARLFSFEELAAASVPLRALGPHARRTGDLHALLIACMHRCTHRSNPYHVNGVAHLTADRLIWLYDIHLLAGRLSTQEWDRFCTLAESKGLSAVCLDGLQAAARCLETMLPEPAVRRLGQARAELPARYLASSKMGQQWMDFCALRSFSNRARYLVELCLPPAEYMQQKYANDSKAALPWLYVRRALFGLLRRARFAR